MFWITGGHTCTIPYMQHALFFFNQNDFACLCNVVSNINYRHLCVNMYFSVGIN